MTTKYNIGDRFLIECEIRDIFIKKNSIHKYYVKPVIKIDNAFYEFDIAENEVQFIVIPEDDTGTKFSKLKHKLIEIGRIILEE